jgi:hypothetical protein
LAVRCTANPIVFEPMAHETWKIDLKVFEYHDRQQIEQEQAAVQLELLEREDFALALERQHEAVQGKARKPRTQVIPAVPFEVSQPEAKKYMPPGSYIHKSNVTCAWCGYVPPYRRMSEPFSVGGSRAALLRLLRRAWRLHNELNRRPREETPVVDLLVGTHMQDNGGSTARSSRG